MSVRWTEKDIRKLTHNLRVDIAAPLAKNPTKHGNRRASWQGQKFDSEHELKRFKEFELERIAGNIRAVIRQVSLPFIGSHRRLRVDFVIVNNDCTLRWVDAKGHPTDTWLLKKALFEGQYGLTLETI